MNIRIPDNLEPLARAFFGAGVSVYAVGGFVRNTLLSLPPADIDVCSALTPEALSRAMPAYGIRVIPKAAEFGTVELHWDGMIVEHTTFRSERYNAGGAHRPTGVSLGGTLEQDAFRRDFTINALYADLSTGDVIDPTGGLYDLNRRALRTTSRDPDEILSSDALRVLRLVRFAGQLGFSVDEDVFAAAKRRADGLYDVAAERKRDELLKILLCDTAYPSCGFDERRSPLNALLLLDELDIWGALIPALNDERGMAQNPRYHRHDVLTHSFHVVQAAPPEKTLRLAALLHDVGKPPCCAKHGNFHLHAAYSARLTQAALEALRFPNAEILRVTALVKDHMFDIQDEAKETTIRTHFALLGREMTQQLISLREADVRGSGIDETYIAARWRRIYDEMCDSGAPFSESELNIDGAAIMRELHLSPGKTVGEIKRALFLHCVNHPQDNQTERLARLAHRYKPHQPSR